MNRNILIAIVMLMITACTTTDAPSNSNNNSGGAPTPTREGDDSIFEIVGDPGSGFGLGDAPDGTGFAAQLLIQP